MPRRKQDDAPEIDREHPLVLAGFWPEPMVREVWRLSDTYWEKWLRSNQVPHRMIGGVRWFHREQLAEWFRAGPTAE